MPRRPSPTRRWLTAATWPVGIALTSWGYTWRLTPLHRREVLETDSVPHMPPEFSPAVDRTEIQELQSGYGPLFHRCYGTHIREAAFDADGLMGELKRHVNRAAPTSFARFQRVLGEGDALALGAEYVVRMPGPWDGPVRVVAETDRSFRLATLDGHLEAGEIEFRAVPANGDGLIGFEIESWARSAGRLTDLLYHHARMSKEVQLHMWVSFLEGVVRLSRGKMTGGVDIDTRQVNL